LIGVFDAAMLPVTYHLPYAGLLAAAAVGLVLGVVAAVIAARQAARHQIMTALRSGWSRLGRFPRTKPVKPEEMVG